MNAYLFAGFVLLVAMLVLILRPFVVAAPAAALGDAQPPASDAAARARAVARVDTVARSAQAAAPVTTATTTATATATTTAPAGTDDVRASVEAAIAARKAALSGTAPQGDTTPHCPSCQSAVDPDDAFCRSCGTQQSA